MGFRPDCNILIDLPGGDEHYLSFNVYMVNVKDFANRQYGLVSHRQKHIISNQP